jgi:hypothetical protein
MPHATTAQQQNGQAAETSSNRQGSAPAGTTRESGLRKLRRHGPECVARVESGLGGWCDLIAIDAAHSTKIQEYRPGTRQNRILETSRLRQVHGSLRTLADPGAQNGRDDDAPGTDGLGLVEVPRKSNGTHRGYGAFSLMDEAGRGKEPTARR